MALTDDEAAKVEKLPKWAQYLIHRLDRDLTSEIGRQGNGPEGSNVVLHNYGAGHTPVGRDVQVGFRMPDGEYVWVQHSRRSGGLEVRTDGTRYPAIMPLVSNAFEIIITERS